MVVLDLAEFVAEQGKPSAREGIAAALDVVKAGGAEVFVQIDPELMLADLRAAIWPGIAGVVISRLESATQIVAADTLIGQLESQRGLLPGSIEVVASLETARGNHDGFQIATASSRICALTLGRADLVMDLRPEPSGEIHMMQYLMQRLINAVGCHRNRRPRGLVASARPRPARYTRQHAGGRPKGSCHRIQRLSVCCR